MIVRSDNSESGNRERREYARFPSSESIAWRVARGRRDYQGRLVERSLVGFTFVASREDVPEPGTRICPTISRSGRRSLDIKTARVTRTEKLNDLLTLVSAEIEA